MGSGCHIHLRRPLIAYSSADPLRGTQMVNRVKNFPVCVIVFLTGEGDSHISSGGTLLPNEEPTIWKDRRYD